MLVDRQRAALVIYSFSVSTHFVKLDQPQYLYQYIVVQSLSHVRLFATPWTVARQPPLSMGFSQQGYWSGLHALLQGIFLTQELKPHLLHLLPCQAGSSPLVPPGKPFVG